MTTAELQEQHEHVHDKPVFRKILVDWNVKRNNMPDNDFTGEIVVNGKTRSVSGLGFYGLECRCGQSFKAQDMCGEAEAQELARQYLRSRKVST